MWNHLKKPFPAFVGTLLIVGQCLLPFSARAEGEGGNPEVATPDTSTETLIARPPARSLAGTPWKQLPATPATPAKIQDAHYLMFHEGGSLTAIGECAHFSGKYHHGDDNNLLITSFRAKRKECTNAAGGDQRFISNLIMANAFRIEGTELTLFQDDKPLMTFAATTDMPASEAVERRRPEKKKKSAANQVAKAKSKASRKKGRR